MREKSSQSTRSGDGMFSKFARGTRISFAEHRQKYLAQCQRVFERQNAELSNQTELQSEYDI